MELRRKRVPARFYGFDTGLEPVREWLKNLEPEDRKAIGEGIKDVEFSWPIGLPLVRSLGHDLWRFQAICAVGELPERYSASSESNLILLHGFVKKRQKTPPHEIDLAPRGKREGV